MTRLVLLISLGLLLASPPAARAEDKREVLTLAHPITEPAGQDDAAAILKRNKKMRIRIEVHTDSSGSSSYNRKVSQARAEAIARALIKRGIKGKRLEPKGYGEDRPIADNKTAAGRAKNRRVELVVIDR